MASFTYNEGALQLSQGGSVDYVANDIEIVLVKSTYAANKDDTNTVLAAAELAALAGYVPGFGGAGRKLLANKTKAKDNATDRIKYDADDPSAWTIAAGDTIGGAIIQKKGAVDDTTAVLLFFLDFADVPTNGGTFALAFHADGVGYIQQ
jgi:hypothetical protein